MSLNSLAWSQSMCGRAVPLNRGSRLGRDHMGSETMGAEITLPRDLKFRNGSGFGLPSRMEIHARTQACQEISTRLVDNS